MKHGVNRLGSSMKGVLLHLPTRSPMTSLPEHHLQQALVTATLPQNEVMETPRTF